MTTLDAEEPFTVHPQRVRVDDALGFQWSIYVIRVDLSRHEQQPGLKIGMVGSGTIGQRLNEHRRDYGDNELLDAWTLAHAVSNLPDLHAWRIVEQFEARLQFAPEFVDPSARLRRLRPDTLVYSYEWFEDDQRILDAVARYAPLPLTLPHGWTLADASTPPEGPGGTA